MSVNHTEFSRRRSSQRRFDEFTRFASALGNCEVADDDVAMKNDPGRPPVTPLTVFSNTDHFVVTFSYCLGGCRAAMPQSEGPISSADGPMA